MNHETKHMLGWYLLETIKRKIRRSYTSNESKSHGKYHTSPFSSFLLSFSQPKTHCSLLALSFQKTATPPEHAPLYHLLTSPLPPLLACRHSYLSAKLSSPVHSFISHPLLKKIEIKLAPRGPLPIGVFISVKLNMLKKIIFISSYLRLFLL